MMLMQQLITWQQEQARMDHLEPYMVLQFNTIKEIVRLQPKTTSDLLRIKGIGPAKARKYGDAILRMVRGASLGGASVVQEHGIDLFTEAQEVNDLAAQNTASTHRNIPCDAKTGEVIDDRDDVVSVTDFVTMMDTLLRTHFRSVRVQGEVVGFKRNASGHAYFEIKDRTSVMRCMIFRDRYDLSGIALTDGVEIVITGYPNYHKQYGFGFVGTMVELNGEGALKKAYDELKKKFDDEGFFAQEKKRTIPQLSQRIGLITSRTGAAIGDFTTNVGHYGYTIIFHQSRVEGSQAIDDLMEALSTMAKKDIDLLVIVRGGGSLESLQAFNNEKVVRMIANFPVPVIAGVGHEQDETLVTLVADLGVSTPTAAARAVRESWDQCNDIVRHNAQILAHHFSHYIQQHSAVLQQREQNMMKYVEEVVLSMQTLFHRFTISIQRLTYEIERQGALFTNYQKIIEHVYERALTDGHVALSLSRVVGALGQMISQTSQRVSLWEKTICSHDPQRQLLLGYSIARNIHGEIIRKTGDVQSGDHVDVYVSDGKIATEVVRSAE